MSNQVQRWAVNLRFEVDAASEQGAITEMVNGTLMDGPDEAAARLRGAVVATIPWFPEGAKTS